MCNVFIGHIVSDKDSKNFGKVLYKNGVYHKKDRTTFEQGYKKAISLK